MRYLEATNTDLKARFERGLEMSQPAVPPSPPTAAMASSTVTNPGEPSASIQVAVKLTRFGPKTRGLTQARRLIEKTCLARYAMQYLDADGTQYELAVPHASREALDEILYALLDEMHRVADANHCFLEVVCHEPATETYWD